ncbi:hypothetical protein L0668_16995 [Paraglaciecola aquimarina]|uniref:Porin n=1 Tax=Paraglaciecola algarum TaxID=3050085 RepID=A0ABS9DA29_9ALTE|nr:hypothetical protein [Paraglaciecola sp. G1-23]MCF2949818.1 hypothetical protein [Paraglaciecola sp. G1-23]
MKKLISLLAVVPCLVFAEVKYSGNAGVEQRYFLQEALYPQQERSNISAYFSPEVFTSFNNGSDSILFKGYFRIDQQDSERTHGDIREFKWTHSGEEWEVQAGIGKVFWGQVESLHLVDVINQTDAIEAVDGEDKLGQPMVSFSLFKDWGNTTIFALPYFRERTFSGVDGRFRGPIPVDTDNPIFESEDKEQNLDWAARWQRSIGDWEVGLSYFDGTSREPTFVVAPNVDGDISVRPLYPQMQQVGIDVLALLGGWIVKFEGVQRNVFEQDNSVLINGVPVTFEQQDYFAAVAGFEYSFVGLFDSVYDINLLMEYQYDDRKELATSVAQNDLMVGTRFVLNDVDGTEILMGVVQDLDYSNVRSGFIEASSRLNDHWKWRVDAWFFSSDEPMEPSHLIRRDDFAQFSLEYYF